MTAACCSNSSPRSCFNSTGQGVGEAVWQIVKNWFPAAICYQMSLSSKRALVLNDALTVNGDVSDVVALGCLFDDRRLLLKLKSPQLLQPVALWANVRCGWATTPTAAAAMVMPVLCP
jgi:hypothetical protein